MGENRIKGFVPELYLGPECNNRCPFCRLESSGLASKDAADARKELELLSNFSKSVRLTGGDTAIRDDIHEILAHTKAVGFGNVCIESNGRAFRKRRAAERLMEAGANWFSIAVFGDRAGLHDRMTGVEGSFEETTRGIRNLAGYGIIGLEARVIITAQNYKRIPEIAQLLWGFGVGGIKLSFAVACGSLPVGRESIPRISDTMPYIKRALDSSGDRDISVSHVPPCIMSGYEGFVNAPGVPSKRVIENPNFTVTIESEIDRLMSKVDSCRGCRFGDACGGLWNEYSRLYGFGEIKPVPGMPKETGKEQQDP